MNEATAASAITCHVTRAITWPLSLRLAHWLGAVLVVMALGLGIYMVQFVHNPGERFELTQSHKSIGISILALTVLRLCLRGLTRAPKPEPAARAVLFAAKAAHVALYALLLMMPLSGWLMATTTPIRVPTLVFGLFALPYPFAPDLASYGLAHTAHVVLASLLASLIVLHIAAAFVHAIAWRDQTLARMWWKPRGSGPSASAKHVEPSP
jgi:cytochrome b561